MAHTNHMQWCGYDHIPLNRSYHTAVGAATYFVPYAQIYHLPFTGTLWGVSYPQRSPFRCRDPPMPPEAYGSNFGDLPKLLHEHLLVLRVSNLAHLSRPDHRV